VQTNLRDNAIKERVAATHITQPSGTQEEDLECIFYNVTAPAAIFHVSSLIFLVGPYTRDKTPAAVEMQMRAGDDV